MIRSKESTLGFKSDGASNTIDKNHVQPMMKSSPMNGGRRLPTIPLSSGAGDTAGGATMTGNTHNAVANAQRDGQPREYRQTMKRSNNGTKLESKKKNKST